MINLVLLVLEMELFALLVLKDTSNKEKSVFKNAWEHIMLIKLTSLVKLVTFIVLNVKQLLSTPVGNANKENSSNTPVVVLKNVLMDFMLIIKLNLANLVQKIFAEPAKNTMIIV